MARKREITKLKWKDEDSSGILIPAGIMIGMGLGFIFDEFVGGLFLGLGLGFVAFFIARNRE